MIYRIMLLFFVFMSSCSKNPQHSIEVYETSENGNKLTLVSDFSEQKEASEVILNLQKKYQTITGFGVSPKP